MRVQVQEVVGGSRGHGAVASSFDDCMKWNGLTMQQRSQTFGTSYSAISEILHAWNSALAVARASQKADLYACVIVLVMDPLDRYTTVQELVKAYAAPDIGLRSRVLALCGDGAIRLQPHLILGAACALRLRQLIEAAIA